MTWLKEATIICYKKFNFVNQNYQRKVTNFVKELAKNEIISISATYKRWIFEREPRDFLNIFLRFWPFEPHFLIEFFI